MTKITFGMVIFPGMTQLDLTGPYEVFSRIAGAEVRFVGGALEAMRSEHGLVFTPDVTFESAPRLDVLFVPGGGGIDAVMRDERALEYLRHASESARFVTSVCTGALALGAAGLLRGYRATTHWLSLELLSSFGATPVANARVVIDRNRITGGGVTAGIDFGLTLASTLHGDEPAQAIQLMMEYAPSPPFSSGTPNEAPLAVVERVRAERREAMARRGAIVAEAARKLAARDEP